MINSVLDTPKIKDIIELGYDTYMKYVSILITTKYDVADVLWFENKIWYEDIKNDWDFCHTTGAF